ncbi:MAG: sulfatase family protein [bacterium]
MKQLVYPLIAAGLVSSCAQQSNRNDNREDVPNILVIYSDDVGYGDVSIYGGKIPTPNIDRMAREGIMFTNSYTTSATCTPSRFSLLTGMYAWRQPGTGVARGDAPALIRPGKETWPMVMQRAGYNTAVIGKWHLGLGGDEGPDWNGRITPGPLEIGFDYSWLIPATNDRVPTVYVENHHVPNLDPDDPIKVSFTENISDRPTGLERPDLLKMMWSHGHNNTITNGISRIGYMQGGESALWRDEDIADVLVEKAIEFIDSNSEAPFFIYYSPVDIHVPRIVHERFQGITPYGPRGDMMVQLDWQVGALMEALEERGLTGNTMVIFTSDNGPVLDDGYVDHAVEKIGDHEPWGELRGGKYSAFEAGTRVPMIVKWPGRIEEGIKSPALFSQVDMLASFASFTGQDYNAGQAIDSHDKWDVLIGEDKEGRDGLVQEAIQNTLSFVRYDGYKYIAPHDGPAIVPWGTGIETGFSSDEQLYDLNSDPGETVNIASEFPEVVAEMRKLLDEEIQKQ